MTVFSQFARTDTSPASGESTFAFLDRVAGPYWDRIRELLESWVRGYCEDGTADIIGRIRSGDDGNFNGAVWELWLYHTLVGLGFEVRCHPEIPGTTKRPDFLAVNAECSFYVEAKVVGEDEVDTGREERRTALFDELNQRVHSDRYWLRVQVDQDGTCNPPVTRLAGDLNRWLAQLDPDEVQRQTTAGGPLGAQGKHWEDESSGWELTFIPILKNTDRPGDRVLAVFGGERAGLIDDRSSIRKGLDAKSRRYGDRLDRPLVIALGVRRMFADDDDIVEALFGEEVVYVGQEPHDVVPGRVPNGVWTSPNGPRRRRLSAVVTCPNPNLWSAAELVPTIWINPWADLALDCNAAVVRQARVTDDGHIALREPTATVRELFGLSTDWPGPEAPFPRRM